MSIKPIFIFSLPRSGSTLLQKILSAHPDVGTTPEPWILLPPLTFLDSKGIYADYNHTMAKHAVSSFCERLPMGRDDFYNAVGLFGQALYEKISPESKYFLDKTPRYHLIASEVMRSFPTGKFIFLFRNPLAVVASIIDTWFAVHLFRVDLFLGLASMLSVIEINSLGMKVKYENLVNDPKHEVEQICQYLGLAYSDDLIKHFSDTDIPRGGFGDPIPMERSMSRKYKGISSSSIHRWKEVLAKSIIRKKVALRYLNWLGEENVELMGYDIHKLIKELKDIQVSGEEFFPDSARLVRGLVSTIFEPYIMKQKISRIRKRKIVLPHQ